MLADSPEKHPQSGFFDITQQLDSRDPLLMLGHAIDWSLLEHSFASLYSLKGRQAKPVRLMCGLLILKQLYNLSDESIVEQWRMNPYYQVFCGETSFQNRLPCHSTELVKFRQRIGWEGIEKLFALSVLLHGEAAEESTVLVDTTVQEKVITYPTDSKLAIKVINLLMAACAWNMRKWLIAFCLFEFQNDLWVLWLKTDGHQQNRILWIRFRVAKQ